jgi:hypothetical protein
MDLGDYTPADSASEGLYQLDCVVSCRPKQWLHCILAPHTSQWGPYKTGTKNMCQTIATKLPQPPHIAPPHATLVPTARHTQRSLCKRCPQAQPPRAHTSSILPHTTRGPAAQRSATLHTGDACTAAGTYADRRRTSAAHSLGTSAAEQASSPAPSQGMIAVTQGRGGLQHAHWL